MKKLIVFLIAINLLSPIQAQDQQSRIDEAIATIQQYAYRIPGMLQKTIDCARGRATCSQEEIRQTRAIMRLVAGAVVILGTIVGTGVIAKRRGWWPFGSTTPTTTPQPSPAPAQPIQPQVPVVQKPQGFVLQTLSSQLGAINSRFNTDNDLRAAIATLELAAENKDMEAQIVQESIQTIEKEIGFDPDQTQLQAIISSTIKRVLENYPVRAFFTY